MFGYAMSVPSMHSSFYNTCPSRNCQMLFEKNRNYFDCIYPPGPLPDVGAKKSDRTPQIVAVLPGGHSQAIRPTAIMLAKLHIMKDMGAGAVEEPNGGAHCLCPMAAGGPEQRTGQASGAVPKLVT